MVLLPMGSRSPLDYPTYSLCDIPLKVVSSHPYLGIQLQCSLNGILILSGFHPTEIRDWQCFEEYRQCQHAYQKIANFSLVRPTLEYASQIWDPYTINKVKKFELQQT